MSLSWATWNFLSAFPIKILKNNYDFLPVFPKVLRMKNQYNYDMAYFLKDMDGID